MSKGLRERHVSELEFVLERLRPEHLAERDRHLGMLKLISGGPVSLAALWKLALGRGITQSLLAPTEIMAILAFGSAVRPPSVVTGWFGLTRRIQPRDADFLVVATPDIRAGARYLSPVLDGDEYATWIVEGGLHVGYCGADRVVEDANHGLDVAVAALTEGVEIVAADEWQAVRARASIEARTPYTACWALDGQETLHGCLRRKDGRDE